MRARDTLLIEATSRRTRPAAVRSTAAALFMLTLGMLAPLVGCLSAQRGGISDALEKLPQAPPAATQPTENRIDADQLVGGIVAKIAPQLEAVLTAAITTTFTAIMDAKLDAKIDARLSANVLSGNTTYFSTGIAVTLSLGILWLAITCWVNQRRWSNALRDERTANDAAMEAERQRSHEREKMRLERNSVP